MSLILHRFIFTQNGDGFIRRSKTEVAVDILKVAMKGATITHITYEAKLNFTIAQKYLEMLKEKELIRQENKIFVTTNKGKTFQELAKELKL